MISRGQGQGVLVGEVALAIERPQEPVDADARRGTCLDVHVRAVEIGEDAEQSVKVVAVHEGLSLNDYLALLQLFSW